MAETSTCSESELFNFVQGSEITGQSAYDIWVGLGNEGSEEDFLEFIRTGTKGDAGKSAYEEWLELDGNSDKTFAEFIASLKGDTCEKGDKGQDWNEVPVDYIMMKDSSTGDIYRVTISGGIISATAI